jgi:phosphatidylinositol glycan class N
MSIFTLLPVSKVEEISTVTYGGLLMFLTGVLYLLFEDAILGRDSSKSRINNVGSRIIMGCQVGMVLLSVIVTRSSIASLQAREGLPLGNQVVGFVVMAASVTLPFVHRLYPDSHYLHRLMIIFLTFSPTFIILAISWEGLFYLVFCMTLVTWVRLEHAIYMHTAGANAVKTSRNGTVAPSKPAATGSTTVDGLTYHYRALTLSDTRVALFFFFLLQSAFFSTGNVASISTFALDSVRRLVPVFDPFSQGALLLFQILIPFAIISANLGILNRRLEVAPSALFMVVMSISDVMTLNFFYMVRDEGSWLDIGMTISHFFIASLLCTFVAGLEFLSELFVSGVDFGPTANALGSAVAQAVNEAAECGHELTQEQNQEQEQESTPAPAPVKTGKKSRARAKGKKGQ